MNRERSLRSIAQAMTRFQEEIADMLDAKATEAEKVRKWITLHMLPHEPQHQGELLKQALGVHDQMLGVIDGLSKMQSSLGQHMNLLLGYAEQGGAPSGPDEGMFGGGMGGKQ